MWTVAMLLHLLNVRLRDFYLKPLLLLLNIDIFTVNYISGTLASNVTQDSKVDSSEAVTPVQRKAT
jgi:hypothetical protein